MLHYCTYLQKSSKGLVFESKVVQSWHHIEVRPPTTTYGVQLTVVIRCPFAAWLRLNSIGPWPQV